MSVFPDNNDLVKALAGRQGCKLLTIKKVTLAEISTCSSDFNNGLCYHFSSNIPLAKSLQE
jgi:hypothetical protein